MKKNIFLLIFLLQCSIIFAQTLVENTACTAYPIDATKTQLEGIMPTQDGISPNVNVPCGSGTTEDNPTWWTFRPSGTQLTFSLTTTDCKAGNCGTGVSLDIWEGDDCKNLKRVKCFMGTKYVLTTTVVPNKRYYLQVDGLCETQCNMVIKYDPNQIVSQSISTKDTEIGEILVYPNPTNDKFYVEFSASAPTALSLYDAQGKLLLSQKDMVRFDDSHYEIAVNDFPNGIYLLKILNANGLLRIRKIIKE
jgi:hypothetical protein